MANDNSTDYDLSDSKMVLQKDFVTISLGVVLTIVNIFALRVLAACKKMMVQIRLMAINLSCTDLLTGVLLIVDTYLPVDISLVSCRALLVFWDMAVVVSYCTTTVLSVDRYISITFPLRYHVLMNETRIKIIMASTWVLGFIFHFGRYADEFQIYTVCIPSLYHQGKYARKIDVTIFAMSILFNIFLNIVMFRRIIKITRASRINPLDQNVRKSMNNIKVFTRVLVITGTFLFLYTPVVIISLMISFSTNKEFTLSLRGWFSLTGMLCVLNSFANPFLYAWRFRECRYQFLMALCFCSEKRREHYQSMMNKCYITYSISTKDTQEETNLK
uniref:Melanocortin receptor 3-like n=1 Tax=Crassostrea virginica TaxID=6565 RepID=A0A8B8DMM2_CRAVI|nr:melanocortin receptor 3-like [Crassostrea virginica]